MCRLKCGVIRGATLTSQERPCALSGIPAYPRQLTYANTLQNTLWVWNSHLTAPSAVHLTTCFLPDSQHRRLSVKASLPLSPLQRFIYYWFFSIVTPLCALVNKYHKLLLKKTISKHQLTHWRRDADIFRRLCGSSVKYMFWWCSQRLPVLWYTDP